VDDDENESSFDTEESTVEAVHLLSLSLQNSSIVGTRLRLFMTIQWLDIGIGIVIGIDISSKAKAECRFSPDFIVLFMYDVCVC